MRRPNRGQLERVRRGLTLRELAAQVGLSEPYVNAILSGRVRPKEETLQKVAETLGLSKEELFDED